MTPSVTIYNSRPDFAGNCYYAFTYSQGNKSINGKISGGSSNIRATMYDLFNGDSSKYDTFVEKDMKIRSFDKMIKNWEYAGCAPDEIAAWIKNKIN